MREGLVGLRHTVGVFTLLDRAAAAAGGIEQLARQAIDHGVLAAATGRRDKPTDRQSLTKVVTHIDRHLVGGTADAAPEHFDLRMLVAQSSDEARVGHVGVSPCRSRWSL